MLFFSTLFITESWKMYHRFNKNIKQQIIISEWFLKDIINDWLKFSFAITWINYILKY